MKSGQPIQAPYLDSAQAPVHEADVADAAAFLLTHDGHAGMAYPVTGPQALTRRQQIDTIAESVGHLIVAQEITAEQFQQEFGQWIPADIIKMLLGYWSDTLTEPDVPRPLETITGDPGRPLAVWAHDHRQDFMS